MTDWPQHTISELQRTLQEAVQGPYAAIDKQADNLAPTLQKALAADIECFRGHPVMYDIGPADIRNISAELKKLGFEEFSYIGKGGGAITFASKNTDGLQQAVRISATPVVDDLVKALPVMTPISNVIEPPIHGDNRLVITVSPHFVTLKSLFEEGRIGEEDAQIVLKQLRKRLAQDGYYCLDILDKDCYGNVGIRRNGTPFIIDLDHIDRLEDLRNPQLYVEHGVDPEAAIQQINDDVEGLEQHRPDGKEYLFKWDNNFGLAEGRESFDRQDPQLDGVFQNRARAAITRRYAKESPELVSPDHARDSGPRTFAERVGEPCERCGRHL